MRKLVIHGLALVIAVTGACAKSPDGAQQQENAATRAIFNVLAADREHPQRCEFDGQWNRYPVPGWLARETLGLTLDVDVSASEEPLRIQDAADPEVISKDSFCSEKEYQKFLEQHEAEKSRAPVNRISLTYPVFDKERKTAIIVLTTVEEGGSITFSGGDYRKRAPELAILAIVLKEMNHKWQIVRTETLGIT